jgi:ATP-dependent DNA helicase RecQ
MCTEDNPQRVSGESGSAGLVVLDELGLALEQMPRLSGRARASLLGFLSRWGHFEALHASLDALMTHHPDLVSLSDLRAQAYLQQGRPDEALAVLEERVRRRPSLTARVALARAHLARGDPHSARRAAQALVQEEPESVVAWHLLGDVLLAGGESEAALAAYRRVSELAPHSRAYCLGMLALYRAQGDLVSASAYAIRLLDGTEDREPLSVAYLRRLVDYFRASGETTRVAELEAELARRYESEREALRALLLLRRTTRRTAPSDSKAAAPAPPENLSTGDDVLISSEEQRRITDTARRLFDFESLLPGQLPTLACVLRGEDVLAILPTGGGKSLCYQLPALSSTQGVTLVISPLIALMKDQIDSLPVGLRGRVTAINSSLDGDELRQRLGQISEGAYRLVYAAPERLRQPPFLHALRCAGVERLVVDEAHCVSVWGHDFRPDYLAIGDARRQLGQPALLAVTATAPARVRQDILRHLGAMRIIMADIVRPNLHLEVLEVSDKYAKLAHLMAIVGQDEAGSGIIYAGTRARCESVAALLRSHGISADHYHAGMDHREAAQERFMDGRTRVMVATIAFGLGIDKPDIRFIVHLAPPDSVEAYYQEAGRAGRDGLPARCILLVSHADWVTLRRRARQGVLSVDFLRALYAAIKGRLDGRTVGKVALPDLERDTQADSTRLRVGLSLLEEAGLLRRGPDFPRAAIVRLTGSGPRSGQPDGLVAFCRSARLRAGQALTLDLGEVARQAGLSLFECERCVLQWAEAGWLAYRPSGRDLLLEVPPAPPDAGERVATLLERYEAIQLQRASEMEAYAKTSRCRHGHLSAYLGGRAIERCASCDNCAQEKSAPLPEAPDPRGQLLSVLRCVSASGHGWGRQTLARILRGEASGHRGVPPLSERACANPCFAALALLSRRRVLELLGCLEQNGLLSTRAIEGGGTVIAITAAGLAALKEPERLDQLLGAPHLTPSKPASGVAEHEGPVDEALYETLRQWRLNEARRLELPPFVIFHDRHLRLIAAHRPTTIEALVALPGIGPRKAERYGAAVLELVRDSASG